MVEQRYVAVREVLDTGASITDVATRYGVNRRTLHRWLVRYASGGLGALADRSSRPGSCPHQIAAEVEARVVAMRRAHPGWGPRTILNRLRRELEVPPSRSAIYRCLVRHGLIEAKKRRRRREDYRRWERSRSMELWQMDVMGEVFLADGTRLSVVTGIDDHSRFCVCARLVVRATAQPVCDALVEALRQHGIPDQILTDNARVFTGKHATMPATVLFDRICHDNGIRHILTAPYSPTTTGKVERLHKTMRKEFFADKTFATLQAAQRALDDWVAEYNNDREHQAIGDVAPVRRFELARPTTIEVLDGEADPPADEEPERARNLVIRRVDDTGRISILNNRYHGRPLSGRPAGESRVGRRASTGHPQRGARRHSRPPAPARGRPADEPAPNDRQARSSHYGQRGLPRCRRDQRSDQLRRHGLPRRQRLQGHDRRCPPRRRHCPDHHRRPTRSHPSSPSRQVQGVRSPGATDRKAQEVQRCRIATEANPRHGYRTSTSVLGFL